MAHLLLRIYSLYGHHFNIRVWATGRIATGPPEGERLFHNFPDDAALRTSETINMGEPIKLMVVEDSRLIRNAVCRIFESDNRLQVVAEAANGSQALDMLPQIDPDVITLDVHMPEMDGIATLKRIMIQHPTPTVMLSNLTLEGARVTFDTLKYGAVDFISKPANIGMDPSVDQQRDMIRRVLLAAGVQMESVRYVRTRPNAVPKMKPAPNGLRYVVTVGAAEGGYAALLKLVPNIDAHLPAAILVQLHAAPVHVDAFAAYLRECSAIEVKRTVDGDALRAGTCYLASGTEYVTMQSKGDDIRLIVHPAPFGDRRGAVDMLMISAADTLQDKAVGVILTGSDEDGVEGLGEIMRNGGRSLVQDPATCLHKQTVLNVLANCQPSRVVEDRQMAAQINLMLKS